MGEMGIPGRDVTLNEQIREVASMNSCSLTILSEGLGTVKLRWHDQLYAQAGNMDGTYQL